MRKGCRLVAAGAFAGLLFSGCAVHGLSLTQDDRVDIVAPGERDEVALPIHLRWTVEDFTTGDGAGSFGVLVDHAPPRPGQSLFGLFKNNEQCKGPSAGDLCRTPEFLAERGVYQTTATQLTIERVPQLSGDDRRREFHEATVVLLDANGERIGESAWSVRFEIARDDKS